MKGFGQGLWNTVMVGSTGGPATKCGSGDK